MRRIFTTAIFLIGTVGWWGFVYPELCLTQDTYEMTEDAGGEDFCGMEDGDMEDYLNLNGKVCIKSRLIEYLYQEKEKQKQEG